MVLRRCAAADDIANDSQLSYLSAITVHRGPPVYICLCNALTDRDIRPHTAAAGGSVSMVYQACGCRPQCGKCVPFVRQMLRERGEAGTLGQDAGAD